MSSERLPSEVWYIATSMEFLGVPWAAVGVGMALFAFAAPVSDLAPVVAVVAAFVLANGMLLFYLSRRVRRPRRATYRLCVGAAILQLLFFPGSQYFSLMWLSRLSDSDVKKWLRGRTDLARPGV